MKMNSVDSLLKTPFRSRQLEEKLKIKELGRPTPEIKITQQASGRNKSVYNRRFNVSIYDTYEWICGCEVRHAMFCFPCVLFENIDACAWSKIGMKDLGHLKAQTKKHNENKTHKHNVLNLAALGTVNIATQLSRAYYESIREHNEKVEKNRHILSRIIDCIKFCGAFELALRGSNEAEISENPENPGVLLGLVDFVSSLDSAVKEHMELNSVFKGTSKTIQNELLDSMLEVCRKNIIEEMKDAKFVAIMVDETTDVSGEAQLVIVFRYEKNGVPCERFWGFFSPVGQNTKAISTCILNAIGGIFKDEPQKIIAQTYDGASVISGEIGGVQSKIKRDYHNAHYTYCYAHQLNLLMERAASQNSSARVFFCNLSAFPSFFSRSPQRLSSLDAVVSRRIPRSSATRWDFKSRTVNVVYEHKQSLIECFLNLEKSKSSHTVQEASSLRLYLENDEFMFWLSFFHKIMPYVDVFYSQLQACLNDADKTKRATTNFIEAISRIREGIVNIDNEIALENKRRKLSCRNADAKEVCDLIIKEARHRFKSVDHLEAAKLLNSANFPEFSRSFPQQELNAAVRTYSMLDKSALKTELSVIYERTEYQKVDGAVPLLQLILKNNLQEAFSELTKLLRIIVTTPMTTVEPERCFSTLKRIKTFLRNTMFQGRLSALAMLSVEKKMVADTNSFNSKVIDVFCANKERRMDFVFRQ